MLPSGDLSDMMYPMTADIYYAAAEQSDFGEMVNQWTMDKVVACSAIKERPDSSTVNAMLSEKFIEYNYRINFRTANDILKSSDGTSYAVTDILITNIKDPSGKLVWFEMLDAPTVFEIGNVEPMFDAFHNFFGYRILLRRADDQSCIE
jgi:DNA-binding ferritin-like protein